MWKELGISFMSMAFQMASPLLRESLAASLIQQYKKAKKTTNPFDDLLVAGVMAALGIATPTED